MKKIRDYIQAALMGIGIGQGITLFFSCLYGVYSIAVPSFLAEFDNLLTPALIVNALYALFGVLSLFSSQVYEKFPLLPATLISFGANVVTLSFGGYYLHWFRGVFSYLPFFVTFTIVYGFIWIINYFAMKHEIENINRKLKE